MPSFYAMPDKLDIDSFVLRHHSVLLNNFADDIRSVDLSCLSDSVEDRIRQTVMALGASTEWGAGAMNGMSAALGDVSKLYRDTEYRILGRDPESGRDRDGRDGSDNDFSILDLAWDLLGNIFGGMGPFSLISVIMNLKDGDYESLLENLSRFIGGGIDFLRTGSSISWGEAFDDWFGLSKPNNAWTYGLEQYFDFKDHPFGSAANWLAQIIKSGSNNIDEFGSEWYSNSRFWEEFVVETGLGVGEDILIGTGVAVAFSVLFPEVAIPAIAVGAVASGVAYVFDKIVGDDLRETISDAICDFGEWAWDGITDGAEWVVDRIGDAADWVGDRLTDAADWVGDRWDDFTGGVSDAFGSFCDWAFG